MSHKFQRGLFVLAAALMLFGALTATAYANLDSEPAEGMHGTSASNPSAGPDYWWRQGWGQTLYPDFELAPPEGMDSLMDGYIIGMLYSVDRDSPPTNPGSTTCATGTVANSIIDTGFPDNYYRATFGGTTNNTGPYGTNADNTIDMLGIFANPPTGIWPYTAPGANPVEGQWYLHYRYFSSRVATGFSDTVHTINFGIDTTPPRPVDNLEIRTGLPLSSPVVTGWQPLRRALISWTPRDDNDALPYDALSGVGYYQVLVDDARLIPEKNTLPDQGRVYTSWAMPKPGSITVENMPPGKHKISIVCVDRATNESTATSGFYWSDPDTPTVEFTSPATGYLKDTSYISVDASDSAAAPHVEFFLDNSPTPMAVFDAPPYRFKPNLAGVTPGPHVLKATATDMVGRTVTTTLDVSTLGPTIVSSDGYIVTDDDSFNKPLTGTTTTNPNDPAGATDFWRQGWGNSLKPQFKLTPPTVDSAQFGYVAGLRYLIDRDPATSIPPDVTKSYQSARKDSANLDSTVDLLGIYLNGAPPGGWPASMLGGETAPYEGYWYLHVLPYTTKAYVPEYTSTFRLGIDVTRPHPVTGLVASPSLDKTKAGVWVDSSRANITWDSDRYDDLSGVGYYKVLVDGVAVVPEGTEDTQGRLYEIFGRTSTSLTIENMPAGKHRVSVVAVDRATNEGPEASTYFYSDTDAPTISFGSFARTVGVTPTFSVVASDGAGIAGVAYRLDGVLLGNQTVEPFSISPNLSAFSAGAHTLMATATDHFGRTAVASTVITLDKTPLSLTKFSRTPSIFYPIKRDKYKDNSTVKFKLNKPASVSLFIRNSKGKTVRIIAKSCPAGTTTMKWDGKWANDKKAHTGTFTYQLIATDAVGNTKKSGKLTTKIRNYQLVKKSGGSVKVIKR